LESGQKKKELMRKLTKQDTPLLLKTLEWWTANFPFHLDREQLITWAEAYPDAVIEKGLTVTAAWYQRQKDKALRPRWSFPERAKGSIS
jgi:hypothetical protein